MCLPVNRLDIRNTVHSKNCRGRSWTTYYSRSFRAWHGIYLWSLPHFSGSFRAWYGIYLWSLPRFSGSFLWRQESSIFFHFSLSILHLYSDIQRDKVPWNPVFFFFTCFLIVHCLSSLFTRGCGSLSLSACNAQAGIVNCFMPPFLKTK